MTELLIVSFIISYGAIYVLILFAPKLKLVDIPNQRSLHTIPKPRCAGVALFVSLAIVMLFLKLNFFIENIYFFISVFLVFMTGLIDDIRGTKPKTKFIVITIATSLLFFTTDFKILSIGTWFGKDISLYILLSFFITIIAVNGYTNALNLIDGLDGLAGGISLVILSAFFYLGNIYHDSFITNISVISIGFLLSFLLFNWHPSKIFLGDSGSLLLGFIISILSIKLIQHIEPIFILLLTALPIYDTILVMVRRIQRGVSAFTPDKTHIHHRLLRSLNGVKESVALMILTQVGFVFLSIMLVGVDSSIVFLIFLIFLLFVFKIFKE